MKTIYFGGLVYTGELPLAEAFAVEDGSFCFVGSNEQAANIPCDERVDLDGRFVCAGFNDSHMHILSLGQALTSAPLHLHTGSLEDLVSCMQQFAASELYTGGWIIGRGWNQDFFSDADRMPNRHDLDRVSETVPVCAVRACGHALAVNTAALRLLGITADTVSPEGGSIGVEDGEPNGLFFDNAMSLVSDNLPAADEKSIKNMLKAAMKMLSSYGVTSSQSDDYCVMRSVAPEVINAAYRSLEAAGEMPVRVYEQCNMTSLSELKAFVANGNMTGRGSDFFKIGPLKMLGDGALGARTAHLREPYADDGSTKGLAVFTDDVFDEMIGYANSAGMQVAVHAIGDACLDSVLNAVEKALVANPRVDHRHGIVHCQITHPEQLERMKKLGMHAYIQSIFLDYDISIVRKRVGDALADTSYNWKTLLQSGVSVSNGTDCPVELPFALGGIQCAVTRQSLSGEGEVYLPNQAFSVKEALDSYTSGGAFASFEENCKGKIKDGFLADFVVLGDNPFTCNPHSIKDIPVLATYVGGQKVYKAG